MNLTQHFNLESFKTKGLTLLIEHAPCCLLSFGAGFIGISVLAHNPILELGFALGGAFLGDHIGHKYFNKDCCKDGKKTNRLRRYSLAFCFGMASWGAHQLLFHDHSEHEHNHAPHEIVEEHDCDHGETSKRPSFAHPALQKALDEAHAQAHAKHCTPE